MKHVSLKKHKRSKILPIALAIILAGILVVIYLNSKSAPQSEGIKVVATTTPKVLVSKIAPKKTVTGPALVITPSVIEQGEPALITAVGVTSISSVKSFTFNNRPLVMFIYEGEVSALLGVDLRAAPGTFPLVLTLNDGKELRENFVIKARQLVQAPFDIPEKLGGNTPQSEKELITTLGQEEKIINAISTSNTRLWTESFGPPLKGVLTVADPYGYTRVTGNYTLAHKGTDFKASIGTPVYAMNRGLVKFTGELRNYGKMVIIDHGLGLQTVYLHLSEISTTLDQMVEKGELIGMSGDTGYVLGPHLHLSVKIWDISIDPIRFLELFGEKN